MDPRILLLSTSKVFGGEYMDFVQDELRDFFGRINRVLFVPFALFDHNAYAGRVRKVFRQIGYELDSLHQANDMPAAIRNTEAIFIGGGNTFRLLKALYDHDLIGWIQERVHAGTAYLGSSAGSNVAGPTIKTTNDMPIVQPPSFDALNLVPFQINPHYLDPDPNSRHMGETREERILQFLEENATPVVALREGAWLRIENALCELKGTNGARLFRKKMPPIELENGSIDRFLPPVETGTAPS
ncbi:MAG TPA: dipeptidase PepE [Chthoniobacterales bacterium]|nr:dipeptidase PepE [Chthoniobacterales bacterium]